MIIEHSALTHAAEMVLKSAGIDLDKDMAPPRGSMRDKPVGIDLLFGLHTAARNSKKALIAGIPGMAVLHSEGGLTVKPLPILESSTTYGPPKRKPGRPSKRENKVG